MKRKLLSILLTLAMMLTLLPTTALAAAPDTVYICGIGLTNGKCLTDNHATSAVDYVEGASYVALYKDGILHLNGLNKIHNSTGSDANQRALGWNYSSIGNHDLVIELVEGSVNSLEDPNQAAIAGTNGMSRGPSLTIQGKGTLNVTGGTSAIWVWEDVVVQKGATVNVYANGTIGTQAGICTNASGHGLTIKQGTTVTIYGKNYGVSADNSATGLFTVLGGNLVIKGEKAALNKLNSDFSGNTVYVSNDVSGAGTTEWNGSEALTSYKCISLSGFSSAVTTYNVTKASATNGSFEVDYTKSMADETVTITATPHNGYEVESVTVTDAGSGNVTVSGEDDSYTFTMPAKDVTVAVTFAAVAPTTYSVTFDANGHGTAPVAQHVTEGETATEPTAPTADGYTFGGWYTDAACTTAYNFSTPVTNNVTLYAKWTADTSAPTGTTYTFAYDAQRSPTFPASVGSEITVSSFKNPLKYGSTISSSSTYDSNTGTWILSEAGTYAEKSTFNPAPTNYLDGVVNTVANNYGLSDDGKGGLMIHKLTDGTNLVGYGVVVAVDETNGYALFIGDLWNNSGAGYLLSKTAISASEIKLNTDQMAESTYSVSLSPTSVTFDNTQVGYTAPTAKTITVTNTGDAASGALSISLSGGDSANFTLSTDSIADIAENGNATFTVVPKTGLAAGTYTATIMVKGDKVLPVTATVSFTVTAEPAPTTYTVTFNANGHGTAPAAATVNHGATVTKPADLTASGYRFGGWYTEAACTTAYDFTTPVTGSFTLYAKWTRIYTGGGSSSTYPVNVLEDADANIETVSDHRNAGSGDTVTITVTPDPYYQVEEVIVKDKDGKIIKVTENKDGTYSFKMPASKVTVEAVYSWDNPFRDVDEDAYYAPAVEWALNEEITGGTTAATFAPGAACTRAQMAAFLWRAAGCPEPAGTGAAFTDVPADAYFAKAVLWAVEQGITNGTTDTTFSPYATCTRAHMAAFLFRMADGGVEDLMALFTDVSLGAYYAEAVQWAVENGITNGTGNGTTYSPNAVCTRAQMVTFLYRYFAD